MQVTLLSLLFVATLLALSLAPRANAEHRAVPAGTLSKADFARLLENYQKFSRMDVPFSQTKNITGLGLQLRSQGSLTVIRPDTVIWLLNKPDFLKVLINAQEISLQSGKHEPERWPLAQIPEKMAANLQEMILWLKFDAEALYQQFHISAHGDHNFSFKRRKNVGAESGFTSLDMVFGPGKNVRQMRMVEKSGDFIDIQFDEPKFQH